MPNTFRNFFSAPVIPDDPEKTQDTQTTHRAGVTLLGLAVFSIPFIFRLQSPIREFALAGTAIGVVIWLLTIYLVKRGKLIAAKVIILVVNSINLFAVAYAVGGLANSTIFTTLFLLAMANLLFPARGAIIFGLVLFILVTVFFLLGRLGLVPEPTEGNTLVSTYLVFIFILAAVVLMLAIASSSYQRNLESIRTSETNLRERNIELDQLKKSLEERITERTAQLEKRAGQLEAISSVARSIASLQDVEELLPAITQLVSERFGYYHAGIFLVDEKRENAVLRAANSEGGRRMLARRHSLKLDANSIVGYTISRQEPRIALDVGADAVFFNNPDLPKTRSEMALPLQVGTQVIGALDVQSTSQNAFAKDDITILSTLADQVAIAIENARLFSESHMALDEAQNAFEKYVRQEWGKFGNQMKHTGFVYDGKRVTTLEESRQQEKRKNVLQTGRLSLEKKSSAIAVPIKLRGQTIGMLDVRSKSGQREWTQDELTLLEAAAERAALALENARLLETSQRRAVRERTIGEIISKIGAVSHLDSIMQTTVEELGRRISRATEVSFEFLGKDEQAE